MKTPASKLSSTKKSTVQADILASFMKSLLTQPSQQQVQLEKDNIIRALL